MKTLESSIADRINQLTPNNPNHHEAIIHHLTILDRAEDLKHDASLVSAVGSAIAVFGLNDNPDARRVATKLAIPENPRKFSVAS